MATAKRVKQEDSVTFYKVPTTTQYFRVVMTDGVEKRREPMSAPVTSTFVKTAHTPQPDRIVLEMSVEEALYLRLFIKDNGSAWDGPVTKALDSVLSPNAGTQTSPAKDVASAFDWTGYKPSWRDPR